MQLSCCGKGMASCMHARVRGSILGVGARLRSHTKARPKASPKAPTAFLSHTYRGTGMRCNHWPCLSVALYRCPLEGQQQQTYPICPPAGGGTLHLVGMYWWYHRQEREPRPLTAPASNHRQEREPRPLTAPASKISRSVRHKHNPIHRNSPRKTPASPPTRPPTHPPAHSEITKGKVKGSRFLVLSCSSFVHCILTQLSSFICWVSRASCSLACLFVLLFFNCCSSRLYSLLSIVLNLSISSFLFLFTHSRGGWLVGEITCQFTTTVQKKTQKRDQKKRLSYN